MHRVFLDANVLFSAAYRADAGLRQLWNIPRIFLCTSRYALGEANINLPEERQRVRLGELSKKLELFEATEQKLPDWRLAPREGYSNRACCASCSRHSPSHW